MNTIELSPISVVEYKKEAMASKVMKAISKFIDKYLVFFQYVSPMYVDPEKQQIWKKSA